MNTRTAFGTAAVASLALLVASTGRPAGAAVLNPADILVNTQGNNSSTLSEYTQSGTLVQSFTIPAPINGLGTEYGRDIIVDPSGLVQVYNGTFNPVLTTLNPATGVQTNHAGPAGWSSVNATDFGGVATYGNFLFATDQSTASGGTPNGIVRFDLTNYSATRFADSSGSSNPYASDYFDLTVGANGLLYALRPGGSPQGTTIDVYNPATEALLRTITLGNSAQSSGIAVTTTGDIYSVAAFSGTIQHFDANGNLVNSLNTGLSYLQDIDLSNSGQLVVGGRFGDVVLTTTGLSGFTHFTVAGGNPNFVAFASPLVPVPEPSSLALAATGALGLAALAARRHRRR